MFKAQRAEGPRPSKTNHKNDNKQGGGFLRTGTETALPTSQGMRSAVVQEQDQELSQRLQHHDQPTVKINQNQVGGVITVISA